MKVFGILILFYYLCTVQSNAMLLPILKNTGQESHKGNECGGFCIAATERSSPGFIVMGKEVWKYIPNWEL